MSTTSLDGVEIETDFNGGPEWLTHNGKAFTKAGDKSETIVFAMDVNTLSTGQAKKATVTLHNISKGIDYHFTVTPTGSYEIISVEQTSSTGNNLNGETINMVKWSANSSYHAQITLQVVSLGGSKVSVSGTGLAIVGNASSTDYTTSYTLDAASNAATNGTLIITNYLNSDNKKTYTIDVKDGTVTYTTKDGTKTAPTLEAASFWVAPVTEGLANWDDAQTKCPDGWKLFSRSETQGFIRDDIENLRSLFLAGGDPAGQADFSTGYWIADQLNGKGSCIELDERSFNSYKTSWTNAKSKLLNVRCVQKK